MLTPAYFEIPVNPGPYGECESVAIPMAESPAIVSRLKGSMMFFHAERKLSFHVKGTASGLFRY
jgi:hypothetical protein